MYSIIHLNDDILQDYWHECINFSIGHSWKLINFKLEIKCIKFVICTQDFKVSRYTYVCITFIWLLPARTDGPSWIHSKYMASVICTGADQIIHRYPLRSCIRWQSTDIRFTISPTVDVFLASLFMVKDWKR